MSDLPIFSQKGPLLVLPPETGHSHWMPDQGGFTTTIVSPCDYPTLGYSMGIQRLEVGETVPEHYHDRHEELFYITQGSGRAILGGAEHRFAEGYTLLFGRNVSHQIFNDGDKPLVWVWIFNPPGLEHVLAGVGTPRAPGQKRPAEVPRPTEVSPLVQCITKRGRPSSHAAPALSR